ncbi:MAG: hypothetical protein PVG65_00595 [Candidatus Thorarchaeota archaeon]|jgi:hypothetical protein
MAYSKKGKKKQNETRKVEWFSAKRNMIKLDGDEDGLFLADNVVEASNFEKYPIETGDTVEVAKGKGEDGDTEITFLRKVKGSDSSSKSETKDAPSDSSSKKVKIIAVRKDKTAVKIEGEKIWPKVAESLQSHESLKAGNEIEVKMDGNTIIAIKKQSSSTPDDKPTKTDSYRDEEATTKRTTSMNAKDIIVALIESGGIKDKEEAENAIKEITKTCYKAIKQL